MKKLAILLLTVFTIGTATACGCGGSKISNSIDDKKEDEIVRIQEIQIAEGDNDGQDEQHKPECPDRGKHDGKFPAPRKPHRRHDRVIPNPKSNY